MNLYDNNKLRNNLIITLIASTLFLTLYYYFRVYKIKKYYIINKDTEYKKTDELESKQKNMYEVLKNFTKLCNENDITYWVTKSTLLGVERHSDIIPWSNTINVTMPKESLEELKNLEVDGMSIDKGEKFHRFNIGKNKEFVRIYEYEIRDDKFVDIHDSTKWIHKKDVFPIKEYKLGNLFVYGPSNTEEYLKRNYGEWKVMKVYKENEN